MNKIYIYFALMLCFSYNSYGKTFVPLKPITCKQTCFDHWEDIYKVKKTDVTKKDYYYLLGLCTAYCQIKEEKIEHKNQIQIK